MKFGDRYIKFMKDRYGIDELYKFLLLICFVLIVINTFISNNIIRLFEVLLIVIIFYRYMSKNIKLRKKENDKYLEIKDKIIKLFDYKDRNTHMYKKCPKCKQKIRLPLKKGKHTVKCPNCGNKFDVACHKDEKIKVEIIK